MGSFTYNLPFGQGRAYLSSSGIMDAIFGGWQFGGIVTYGSGFPFTPLISGDPSNTGTFGSVRPNLIGDPSRGRIPARIAGSTRTRTRVPDAYTFGDAPRNSITGPDFLDIDLYLSKQFPLGRDMALEFRIEAFNVANRANFAQPDPFIDSDSGGTITGPGRTDAGDPVGPEAVLLSRRRLGPSSGGGRAASPPA